MNIKEAVAVVEGHKDYMVLRRFKRVEDFFWGNGHPVRQGRGVYIDTETTGLDVTRVGILELAIVPFDFVYSGDTMLITHIDAGHSFLNDPGVPVDETTRQLTGITQEEIAGKSIPADEVQRLCENVDLVVAHNADYDRRIVERFFPVFKMHPWACSQKDVPWREGFGAIAAGLEVLALTQCGVFYDAHRALIDCQVGIHLLATARDANGTLASTHLWNNMNRESVRVWAVGAPFHTKDLLKGRGYHWNDGSDGRPKAWHKSVPSGKEQEEMAWLRENTGGYPRTTVVEAVDRYSVRDL